MLALLLTWFATWLVTVNGLDIQGLVEVEGLFNIARVHRDYSEASVPCFYHEYTRVLSKWTHDVDAVYDTLTLQTRRGRCIHFAARMSRAAKRCGLPYRFTFGHRHVDLEVALTMSQRSTLKTLQGRAVQHSRSAQGHQWFVVGYYIDKHSRGSRGWVGLKQSMTKNAVIYYPETLTVKKVSSKHATQTAKNRGRRQAEKVTQLFRRWVPKLRQDSLGHRGITRKTIKEWNKGQDIGALFGAMGIGEMFDKFLEFPGAQEHMDQQKIDPRAYDLYGLFVHRVYGLSKLRSMTALELNRIGAAHFEQGFQI